MSKDYEEFANLLNKHLGKKGCTVSWLARKIGMSASTISKWINDTQRPGKPETVIRLAEALELESDERKEFFKAAGYSRYWNVPLGALDNEQPETNTSEIDTKLDTSVEQREQEFLADLASKFDSLINQKLGNKPLQRPARVEHFQGREAELAYLLDNLHLGRVVTLCGPGGIGKSALASQAVRMLAPGEDNPERFPDGIVSYNFYTQPQVDNALEHIVLSFGGEPRPSPKEAARRVLAGKRALLILESADNANNLREILEVRDQCGVLITSRSRKDAFHNPLIITPLPQENGLALLTAWSGNHVTDIDAARRIVDIVDGFPLAICLVGHYLAQTEESDAEYLVWLEQAPLDALDQGQHQEQSVRLLIQRSLEQVSEKARQTLGVIGLLASAPFTAEPIAAALEITNIEAKKSIGDLVNYGLLMPLGGSYIVSHRLVHTYAYERLAPPTKIITKLAGEFEQVIQQSQGDFSRLNTLRPHVLALMRTASERELWGMVIALARSIDNYLDLQGYWSDHILATEFAITATQATKARQAEGGWLGVLGNVYIKLGQAEKAIGYQQQSLDIAKEFGDRKGEGDILGNLGNIYINLGQMEKGISYYQQALSIAKEFSDRKNEGNWLNNLGFAYSLLGQIEKSISYYQQSLDIAKEFGDRKGEGDILGNLGNIYINLGQIEKGISYYQQALSIAKEIGDRRNEGSWLNNLGLGYSSLGQLEQAIGYYEQALVIAKETCDRMGEGKTLGNLGSTHSSIGQVETAISYYQQSLTIAKETGDHRSEGHALGNLGSAYSSLGQLEKAIGYHLQALAIAKEIDDRRGEGAEWGSLGNIYARLGQVETAVSHYQQALIIAKELGNRRVEMGWLANLGLVYRIHRQVNQVIEYYEQALIITRELGDRSGEGNYLGDLANAYYDLGQLEQAIEYYKQALVITRELGDRSGEGNHLGDLGIAYHDLGQLDQAIEYYEQALVITKELGDRSDEGNHLCDLGTAYHNLGQVEKAKQYWQESLYILEEIKSPNAETVRIWLSKFQNA